ncbi:HD domain-containing protein [Clostridium brassicae]|uniref:HD domain-containing protein n=1 Tax=Clostridium brassicae TaxID=2999072 RepID=A0ABT4DAQ5_9CLOT|nr:HD domain-containing protein [Clostridium brassicae]MCY6959392.1 HD domain-containing protein [Clostridium brassicae]
MKEKFIKNLQENKIIEETFMIMKKLKTSEDELIAFIGDRSGDIKSIISYDNNILNVGDVIKVTAIIENGIMRVETFQKIEEYNIQDFLPTIDKDIDEIMNEIKDLSDLEFKSIEARTLDEYFFGNEKFINRFKKGIGGLRQHHNYIGGLAEHTLNVMYLARTLAYRYDSRYKEIAILGAKLHDIGKIEEYYTDGPFDVTIRGDMEGHIVIGVTMLEEAFNAKKDIYSEDFKSRIKGCMVQHHGKVEYGSPKGANMEESFIVNFADSIDAVMNKISQIKEGTEVNTWSQYDRRIGTKLFL